MANGTISWSKPWYKSLGVVGVAVAGAVTALEKEGTLPDGTATTVMQFVGLAAALWGRLRAKDRLTLR